MQTSCKAETLCGKNPCPRLCLRSCHCQAGQERVKLLGAVYHRRRALRRPLVAEIGQRSKARKYLGAVVDHTLFNVFGPERYPRHSRPPSYGMSQLKPWLEWESAAVMLIIVGLVVIIGTVAGK